MSPKNSDDEYSDLGYYSAESITKKKTKNYWEIIALVVVWYLGAVATITTSKQTLNSVKLPFLLCLVQFVFATVLTYLYLVLTKSLKAVPSTLYATVFQISTSYTFGFILTNSAFSIVTAAFAETVKATEPFTTVAIGKFFFAESASLRTYATLIPVCLGVAFSCYHDDTFNLLGFLLAFGSNFGFSTRAVLAKRLNLLHRESLDEINLFYQISWMGLIYLIPITLFFEGREIYDLFFHASYYFRMHQSNAATNVDVMHVGDMLLGLMATLLINGCMFALYNLVSYLVLRRTELITHSVLNAFRRVFIILFTTYFFGLHLRPFNLLGVFVAVLGVILFGYSKSKDSRR